jgi:Uma2 family endonuclease
MNPFYEEIFHGETVLRRPPGARHEIICGRLHTQIARAISLNSTTRLLAARSIVQLQAGTLFRPDLALVTTATGKLWLAAEIISSQDHRIDTVIKKSIYEETNLPRLWMIDPRYDNIEVYHGGEYGLALRHILAGRETLTEKLLPGLDLKISSLFC